LEGGEKEGKITRHFGNNPSTMSADLRKRPQIRGRKKDSIGYGLEEKQGHTIRIVGKKGNEVRKRKGDHREEVLKVALEKRGMKGLWKKRRTIRIWIGWGNASTGRKRNAAVSTRIQKRRITKDECLERKGKRRDNTKGEMRGEQIQAEGEVGVKGRLRKGKQRLGVGEGDRPKGYRKTKDRDFLQVKAARSNRKREFSHGRSVKRMKGT